MSELPSTEVTGHRKSLLLLLGSPRLTPYTVGLQLMLLQLFFRLLGLIALLTLDLLALGHPAALHMNLEAAVEMEAFVTGLADEALLGRVWGGRSVFVLSWQGTRLCLVILVPSLACYVSELSCLFIHIVGFRVKFSPHLPPLLPNLLSKETCTGEKLHGPT